MKTIEEVEEKLSALFQAGRPCPDCGTAENCPTNIALAILKDAGDDWRKFVLPVSKLLFFIETIETGDKIKTLCKLLNEFDHHGSLLAEEAIVAP